MPYITHLFNFLKNLFRRRIWKEKSRQFLRSEQDIIFGFRVDYYLIKYEDILSGETKQKEIEVSEVKFP